MLESNIPFTFKIGFFFSACVFTFIFVHESPWWVPMMMTLLNFHSPALSTFFCVHFTQIFDYPSKINKFHQLC